MYREATRSYEVVYDRRCTQKRKWASQTDPGPGLYGAGERTVYFDMGPRFRDRDLIELYEGPESPCWLETESATYPRGHHVEVRVSEYRGPTPEVES